MKKLKIYSSNVLSQIPNIKKELHNFYYDGPFVIKLIRYDIDPDIQEDMIFLEETKAMLIDQIDLPKQFLNPLTILYDEFGYRGYTMEKIKIEPFFPYDHSLETVYEYFKQVTTTIEYGHKQGIIFPDLFSEGNINYDPYKVIDMDGWQIKNLPTMTSYDLKENQQVIINNLKFFDKENHLFTKEFDFLVLINQFLLVIFGINLLQTPNLEQNIDDILNMVGLDCDPYLYRIVKDAFDFNSKIPLPNVLEIISYFESHYTTPDNDYEYTGIYFQKLKK